MFLKRRTEGPEGLYTVCDVSMGQWSWSVLNGHEDMMPIIFLRA